MQTIFGIFRRIYTLYIKNYMTALRNSSTMYNIIIFTLYFEYTKLQLLLYN